MRPGEQRIQSGRRIGLAVLGLAGTVWLGAQPGCMVEQKCFDDTDCEYPAVCTPNGECVVLQCYDDTDCAPPKICGEGGVCVFQCEVDEDCTLEFGEEYVCTANHCIFPAQCAVCVFPNADASCLHGVCAMGSCHEGFVDANGDAQDGCEYACTPSSGGVEICDGLDNDCNGQIDDTPSGDCNYQCTPTGDEVCDSIDNDCDGEVDEDGVCGSNCPPYMVAVDDAFCIDEYEASRDDATATSQGVRTSVALSRPGVLPWMVNPMSAEHFAQFQTACAAAGKRLCTKEEWFQTCTGTEGTVYVYGNTFDREICNCVDTFCDDYCEENGISAAQCPNATNCGYAYESFHEVPTGEFADCVNEYGAFDINGNVWEVVPSSTDSRGFEVRGGAFNCAGAMERVSCSFNASWSALYAGFRCCKDLP